ncbi:MAG: NERD domain-containing protein [Vulcanimicrobiota bacterium]
MATRNSLSTSNDWPYSERKVWDALGALPTGWHVFHSVAWFDEGQDGEADFVILHPEHGLAVLEVKGGGIEVDRGQWYSVNRNKQRHSIKNPFEQAMVASKTLRRHLCNHVNLSRLPSCYAVVFPDMSSLPRLGPREKSEVVWLRDDLLHPQPKLIAMMGRCRALEHVDVMVDLLAPRRSVAPLLAVQVEDVGRQQMVLTEQQFFVLNGLRRNRRFFVTGGAGTGKTVLAIEQARRLAQEGLEVLLTCYNEPLGSHLAERTRHLKGVQAVHFHGLAVEQMKKAGLPTPAANDSAFWNDECPRLLAHAAAQNGFKVDAIVADEAQDFLPLWWEVLEKLLKQDRFYIFGDTDQNIYRDDDWRPPVEGFTYELTVNCRNTRPVAGLVGALQRRAYDSLPVEGPEPEFSVIEDDAALLAQLETRFQQLQEHEISANQVAILCQTRALRDFLVGRTVHRWPLSRMEARDAVTVETVHRFKGLESDVVLLLQDRLTKLRDFRLAAIGVSRARSQLFVLGSKKVIQTMQALPRMAAESYGETRHILR